MKGGGLSALLLIITLGNSVNSDEATKDLNDYLQRNLRSGVPNSDSSKFEESANDQTGDRFGTGSTEDSKRSEKRLNEEVLNFEVKDNRIALNATAMINGSLAVNRDDSGDKVALRARQGNAADRTFELNEYIFLRDIGLSNELDCNHLGEMHYFSSTQTGCLICVCLHYGEMGAFAPVCASCSSCNYKPEKHQSLYSRPFSQPRPKHPYDTSIENLAQKPYAVPPDLLTENEKDPFYKPIKSSVSPFDSDLGPTTITPEATCSPLPENLPFQHPLNPCQICMCRKDITLYGQVEVRIGCQENQQCVLPIKDLDLPDHKYVLLPQCREFPANVRFPHPTVRCKQCMCSDQMRRVICEVIPGCVPDAEPYSPVYPDSVSQQRPLIEPTASIVPYYPATKPMETGTKRLKKFINVAKPPNSIILNHPSILQPQQTTELLRELPADTESQADLSADPRSPLPGPRPHTTCSPFQVDVPFQHPWDRCQVCICSEAVTPPHVDIEVNCFTKVSCCTTKQGELLVGPIGKKIITDPICEQQMLNQFFVHPHRHCRTCVCRQFENIVAPSCNVTDSLECNLGADVSFVATGPTENGIIFMDSICRFYMPYQTFEKDCSRCYCEVVYNLVKATCIPVPGCVPTTLSPYILPTTPMYSSSVDWGKMRNLEYQPTKPEDEDFLAQSKSYDTSGMSQLFSSGNDNWDLRQYGTDFNPQNPQYPPRGNDPAFNNEWSNSVNGNQLPWSSTQGDNLKANWHLPMTGYEQQVSFGPQKQDGFGSEVSFVSNRPVNYPISMQRPELWKSSYNPPGDRLTVYGPPSATSQYYEGYVPLPMKHGQHHDYMNPLHAIPYTGAGQHQNIRIKSANPEDRVESSEILK